MTEHRIACQTFDRVDSVVINNLYVLKRCDGHFDQKQQRRQQLSSVTHLFVLLWVGVVVIKTANCLH